MGAAIWPWVTLQLVGLAQFFTHLTQLIILAKGDVKQTEKFML